MPLQYDNNTAEDFSAEETDNDTHKPDLPEFPREAITGLIKRYIDLVGGSTEAPDAFHWAIFITVVGLLIGRKVYINHPSPLFLNFFLLLVGQTGLSRKSTAMELGIRYLLDRIDDRVAYSSGAVSSEGIYEILGKEESTRLLLNYDEARSLLQISKRQVTSNLLPRLNSLYACPSEDSVDRSKNSTSVIKPFVSLITASPIEWLVSAIEHDDIMGGFLNRFLIVSGQAKEPIPFAKVPSDSDWKTFADELLSVIGDYIRSDDSIEMTWSDGAKALYEDFYNPWYEKALSLPGETAALSSRTSSHVTKIAMMLSVLSSAREITPEAMSVAVTMGKYLEEMAHILFSDVGLSRQGRVERMIITRLRNNNSLMEFRHLRQSIGSKTETESFNRAIAALEKAGIVKMISRDIGPKMIVLVGA